MHKRGKKCKFSTLVRKKKVRYIKVLFLTSIAHFLVSGNILIKSHKIMSKICWEKIPKGFYAVSWSCWDVYIFVSWGNNCKSTYETLCCLFKDQCQERGFIKNVEKLNRGWKFNIVLKTIDDSLLSFETFFWTTILLN